MISQAGSFVAPKHMATTMLALTVVLPADPMDPESIPLTFTTWTTGETKATAMRDWKRDAPLMASLLTEVNVVTPVAKPAAVIEQPTTGFGKPRGVYASRRVA